MNVGGFELYKLLICTADENLDDGVLVCAASLHGVEQRFGHQISRRFGQEDGEVTEMTAQVTVQVMGERLNTKR